MKKAFAAGASASLKKTIRRTQNTTGRRQKIPTRGLRRVSEQALADLSEKMYRRGFKRGHMEARQEFERTGTVPSRLDYKSSRLRQFYLGNSRPVKVSSKLTRETKRRAP